MNINVSRRQTIGGLAAAALVAGIIAVGLSTSKTAEPVTRGYPAGPQGRRLFAVRHQGRRDFPAA